MEWTSNLNDILAVSWENLSLGFQTRSDINQAVQSQKMARYLKFRSTINVVKTKGLISCVVTVQLICACFHICRKQVFS